MSRSPKEAKTIAAVPCPTCHAPVGRACRMAGSRPMVCSARLDAWKASDRTPDFVFARQSGAHYVLIAPQSTAARVWLEPETAAHPWVAGSAKVAERDMPGLKQRMIAAGWRTGDAI